MRIFLRRGCVTGPGRCVHCAGHNRTAVVFCVGKPERATYRAGTATAPSLFLVVGAKARCVPCWNCSRTVVAVSFALERQTWRAPFGQFGARHLVCEYERQSGLISRSGGLGWEKCRFWPNLLAVRTLDLSCRPVCPKKVRIARKNGHFALGLPPLRKGKCAQRLILASKPGYFTFRGGKMLKGEA